MFNGSLILNFTVYTKSGIWGKTDPAKEFDVYLESGRRKIEITASEDFIDDGLIYWKAKCKPAFVNKLPFDQVGEFYFWKNALEVSMYYELTLRGPGSLQVD